MKYLQMIFYVACSFFYTQVAALELSISHFLPPSHGIHTDFLEPWARALEKKTNGEVKVRIYTAGTHLGRINKQAAQVRSGIVDMAHGLHSVPSHIFPRTAIMHMPFLVKRADVATKVMWDLYQQGDLGTEYDDFKVLALHAHNGGHIHTREFEVKEVEDFKGLRLRAPSPITSSMLKHFKAHSLYMPPNVVYNNLKNGVLKGTIFTWDAVGAFKLYEVLDYHTEAYAYTSTFYFLMNKKKYDRLPENVRTAIDELSGDALIPKFGTWWDKWDAKGRHQVEKKGNTIIKLTEEQRAQWRKQLEPMITVTLKKMQAKGIKNAPELYRKVQNLVEQYQ